MTVSDVFARLGLDYPIFQAPIGSIAQPELVAAVSNAGGLGHFACTWTEPDKLHALFEQVRMLTHRPFGANLVLDFPIESQLDAALAAKVPVISFFWGDGSRYLDRVKAGGAVAIQAVGSIAEARRAAAAGFDLIVAQGREAGGHVAGTLGTIALLPQVVDAVGSVPVLAAGGISDRRGVAAAIALGAAGVWVGTRFLAAGEAYIHPHYQKRVLAADGDETLYSELFDIGWPDAPLRTLKSETTRRWEEAGRPLAPHRPGEGEIVGRRIDGSEVPRYFFGSPTAAVEEGAEAMALYVGEAVGLVRKTESAAAIVADLARGLPG
jgi:nitronate monooxygenase